MGLGRRGGGVSHRAGDRKSTRLNSSHLGISYAVFCLKKTSTPRRRGIRPPTGPPFAPRPRSTAKTDPQPNTPNPPPQKNRPSFDLTRTEYLLLDFLLTNPRSV